MANIVQITGEGSNVPKPDFPLELVAGSALSFDVSYFEADGVTPINLPTGANIRLAVRKRGSSSAPLLAVDGTDRIAVVDNTASVALLAPDTQDLPCGCWRYQLEADFGGGSITPLLRGTFTIVSDLA